MLKFKIQLCHLAAYYCTTLHSLYNTSQSPLEKKTHVCGQGVARTTGDHTTHYNTLQHTASPCTCVGRAMWELKATTQHTATRCNTLHLCENSDAGTIGACVSNMQQPPTTTVSCQVTHSCVISCQHFMSFHVSISCPFMSARAFKTHTCTHRCTHNDKTSMLALVSEQYMCIYIHMYISVYIYMSTPWKDLGARPCV